MGSTVIALGVVSLLADLSTEMIVPVLPFFIVGTLGASIVVFGLIDGASEAAANFIRLGSGFYSDRVRLRKPLVIAGYLPTAVLKPLLAISTQWWHVLLLRVPDRMAKGGRGPARDSLLADSAPPELRGAAFGLHRSLDTAGAIGGAILAVVLVTSLPGTPDQIYRTMFLIAALPAIASVAVIALFVRERPRRSETLDRRTFSGSLLSLPGRLRFVYLAAALFTLGTISPGLALYRGLELGTGVVGTIMLFLLYNLVEVAVSFPAGSISDRVGRFPLLLIGYATSALAAAFFAFGPTITLPLAFALLGAAAGLTHGVHKALVVDLAPKKSKGTALGVYYGLTGSAALGAGLLIGSLWMTAGGAVAFAISMIVSLVALSALLPCSRSSPITESSG